MINPWSLRITTPKPASPSFVKIVPSKLTLEHLEPVPAKLLPDGVGVVENQRYKKLSLGFDLEQNQPPN